MSSEQIDLFANLSAMSRNEKRLDDDDDNDDGNEANSRTMEHRLSVCRREAERPVFVKAHRPQLKSFVSCCIRGGMTFADGVKGLS